MLTAITRNFRKSFTHTKKTTQIVTIGSNAAFATDDGQKKKVIPWEDSRILIAGCQGQIGTPLVRALCKEIGAENVIATDVSDQKFDFPCRYEKLDVTDGSKYEKLVKENGINYIVHLAGILSALGERNPDLAIDVNVLGVVNVMKIAQQNDCRIFLPSSIAVFGGDLFPKRRTPVDVILQPKTIYGVSKVFNEMMGEYYSKKFNLDFRSLRYPGVISSEKYAFNGTTDYSTEVFFHALENRYYECWLAERTALPMIYIDDCIDATVKYLKADPNKLESHVYNLAGISFTPEELFQEVQRLIPGTVIEFAPDYRQQIANQWPKSIDDSLSRIHWNWEYNLTTYDLAEKILKNIDPIYKTSLIEQTQAEPDESQTEDESFENKTQSISKTKIFDDMFGNEDFFKKSKKEFPSSHV